MKQENLNKNIDDLIKELPRFVHEYYISKMSIPMSKKTLYEYLKEYKRFFNWLINSNVTNVNDMVDISLSTLENLSKRDAEAYFVYLRENTSKGTDIATSTILRTKAALSSLFRYLTEETENSEGEPYFYRNVMKKIKIKKKTETLAARAANIKADLLIEDEFRGFIDFIENKYDSTLSQRARVSFYKNKLRDIAVIAILLGTGIRLSECVNLDIKDINFNTNTINVVRKGGKKDNVYIANFATFYIKEYVKQRKSMYNLTNDDIALFITTQSGKPARLGYAAIERLVAKYSSAYKKRITPHKLRHSLATQLYNNTKNPILVAQQLGHSSTNLVGLYSHILDDTISQELDNL